MRALRPYGFALLAIAVAVVLAVAAPQLGLRHLERTLLLIAIGGIVWHFGRGPGIAALVASVLCLDFFFARPPYQFSFESKDLVDLGLFGLFALVIGAFTAQRRSVEHELESTVDRLNEEIAVRTRQGSLLDLTHDSIFVRDMNDVITYWNRGAQELMGWTAAQAVGRRAGELLQTVFPRPVAEIRAELLRSGRWEGELTKTRADGRRVVVTTRWSLQCDAQGRPLAILDTNNDITERKHREEDIRRLNAQLERRSSELEASNKELEAFAYSVSHDLRAPLRHVAAYGELLQKTSAAALDERGRRYVASLLDAGRKMGMLIDDLLAFSRIGRAETRMTLVSLGELARDVVREIARDTEGRDVVWKIAEPLPSVRGDRSMLKLALLNLVANAVKFSRTRPRAVIEIGCDGGTDAVVLFVRDNGVGFDMKYVKKLFGVFQRLHRSEEFEGTGIGLAIVHRIIARHGGRAWAEGAVDGGATFRFSLPRP